jgi:hypothetical protein
MEKAMETWQKLRRTIYADVGSEAEARMLQRTVLVGEDAAVVAEAVVLPFTAQVVNHNWVDLRTATHKRQAVQTRKRSAVYAR